MRKMSFMFTVFVVIMAMWVLLGNMLGALFCSVDILFDFLLVIMGATALYHLILHIVYRVTKNLELSLILNQESMLNKWIGLTCVTIVAGVVFNAIPHEFWKNLAETKGIEIALGCLFFPVIYSFSDVISEVYGYKLSRQVAHVTSFINLVFTVTISLSVVLFTGYFTLETSDIGYGIRNMFLGAGSVQEALSGLFHDFSTLRIVLAGSLSALTGSFLNDIVFRYFQHKDGVYRFEKRRAISSTLAELLDSTMFFVLAFGGLLPWSYMPVHIICNFLAQIIIEMGLLPLTRALVVQFRRLG